MVTRDNTHSHCSAQNHPEGECGVTINEGVFLLPHCSPSPPELAQQRQDVQEKGLLHLLSGFYSKQH